MQGRRDGCAMVLNPMLKGLGVRGDSAVSIEPARIRMSMRLVRVRPTRPGQLRRGADFELENWSMKEAAPERLWKVEARRRINRSDVLLVVVGRYTYRARGVLDEVRMARNADPLRSDPADHRVPRVDRAETRARRQNRTNDLRIMSRGLRLRLFAADRPRPAY